MCIFVSGSYDFYAPPVDKNALVLYNAVQDHIRTQCLLVFFLRTQ
jgi:hypothetical protein